MKFQSFKCACGYVCITPERTPICPDCGATLTLVMDESGITEIDQKIRPVFSLVIGRGRS